MATCRTVSSKPMPSGSALNLPVSEWVSKCLAAMTPANKEAASAELKQVIASAYTKNELWTMNWSIKELERSVYRSDLISTRTFDEPHWQPQTACFAAIEA
jgi:hypothetical protein